jgi:hypothetical protein
MIHTHSSTFPMHNNYEYIILASVISRTDLQLLFTLLFLIFVPHVSVSTVERLVETVIGNLNLYFIETTRAKEHTFVSVVDVNIKRMECVRYKMIRTFIPAKSSRTLI